MFLIVDAVNLRKDIPEFAVEVPLSDVIENENMIKPGLYFEMRYPLLHDYSLPMDVELKKLAQKRAGLVRTVRSSYARNLLIKWFVDFELPLVSAGNHQTEYGEMPKEIELTPLEDLIDTTLGGEWGKENIEGRYDQPIKCIRGTDIPNVAKAYYDDVPVRYVQKKHIKEKLIMPNDIIVEISGGSPIQSTGRICFITKETLEDMELPVLCTNFCRVIRLKEPKYAEFVYNYLLLLYTRGYFFNLENNTTGIKNLIFGAFVKNIKVPMANSEELFDRFYDELDEYCKNI